MIIPSSLTKNSIGEALMNFNFPEIKTSRTNEEQVRKITDEVKEYIDGNLDDEEAVDILHATETFIRIHFKGRELVLSKLITDVIEKNTKRGYYSQQCF